MAKRRKSATVQLKVRMKEALRAALATAAEEHEVTLNAEVVDRLEKSIGREKARHEDFGGRELYGLLKMMAGAAAMIEERRGGKKWSSDFETFHATKKAWERLIAGTNPGLPEELKREIQVASPPAEPYPAYPEFPTLLAPSGPGLLGSYTPEEIAANAAATAEHAEKVAEWQKADALHRDRVEEWRKKSASLMDRFSALESLGQSVAEQIIPPRGDAKTKPWHSDW